MRRLKRCGTGALHATHPPLSLPAAMAGDVNLYWNDHDDPTTAEIEVMVAEGRSRRKGLAAEALTLFMGYAAKELVRAGTGTKAIVVSTVWS